MAISLATVFIALTLLFQDCLAANACCYNADCPYLSFVHSSEEKGASISGVDDSTCCPSGGSSYVKYGGSAGDEADACRCGNSIIWLGQTCPYNEYDAAVCITCSNSYNGVNFDDACPNGGSFVQYNTQCYCSFSINSETRYVPQYCPSSATSTSAPAPGTTSCSTCTTSSGSCIPTSWICDGETDCTSGADEPSTCPTPAQIPTPNPTSSSNSDTETLDLCEFILDNVDSVSFAIVGNGECDIASSYTYSFNGYGGTTIVNDATCNYDGGDCCMATNPQLTSNGNCMNPQYQDTEDVYTACARRVEINDVCIHDGYYATIKINGAQDVSVSGDTCNWTPTHECRSLESGDVIQIAGYLSDGSFICMAEDTVPDPLEVGKMVQYSFSCSDGTGYYYMNLYLDIFDSRSDAIRKMSFVAAFFVVILMMSAM